MRTPDNEVATGTATLRASRLALPLLLLYASVASGATLRLPGFEEMKVRSFGWESATQQSLVGDRPGLKEFNIGMPPTLKALEMRVQSSGQCERLEGAAEAGQRLGDAVVRAMDGGREYRYLIRDASLSRVDCQGRLAEIRLEGESITYDDRVPPPGRTPFR